MADRYRSYHVLYLQDFCRRAKRNIVSVHNPPVLNDDDDAAAGHCARRSVVINFDDLGWNHILAPKQVSRILVTTLSKNIYIKRKLSALFTTKYLSVFMTFQANKILTYISILKNIFLR